MLRFKVNHALDVIFNEIFGCRACGLVTPNFTTGYRLPCCNLRRVKPSNSILSSAMLLVHSRYSAVCDQPAAQRMDADVGKAETTDT